jgi:hypothetical protein
MYVRQYIVSWDSMEICLFHANLLDTDHMAPAYYDLPPSDVCADWIGSNNRLCALCQIILTGDVASGPPILDQ